MPGSPEQPVFEFALGVKVSAAGSRVTSVCAEPKNPLWTVDEWYVSWGPRVPEAISQAMPRT